MTSALLEAPENISDASVASLHQSQLGHSALCLAGLGLVSPGSAAQPYAVRWYRAWEQQLYRRVRGPKGGQALALQRFASNASESVGKAAYREVMTAVSQAAKLAMADADGRCGRRHSRERSALLYSDFWCRSSHLEQAFNWRDSFDLDVIPKFVLREQGIDGYSAKLQAGRSFIAQGLQVAADLLYGGDIDLVMLGGLFRFYPALGFSEAVQNQELERRWLGRGGRHPGNIVERAGFIVLRRAEAASQLRSPSLLLGTPEYLQLPRGLKAAQKALRQAWQEQGECSLVVAGNYPSSRLQELEFASQTSTGRYCNSVAEFGDSGGLNPLLAMQQLLNGSAAGCPSSALLSLSEATGATWLIPCQPLLPRMSA